MSYRFERKGRSRKALIAVLAAWTGVLLAWWAFDIALWIVGLLLLFTVPAALDYARDRRAWMALEDGFLRWGSGRQSGEIALARIAKIRLEMRLDMSLRVRVELEDGKRIALPQDSTPPIKAAEAAFDAAGLRCERHPFGFL